jgi:hypothetical protein
VSARAKYPFKLDDGRENPYGAKERILRGGGLYLISDAKVMRCAYRSYVPPEQRINNVGFRVAVATTEARWKLAFPEDRERQNLARDLEVEASVFRAHPRRNLVGYEIAGVRWHRSGVYIRCDRLNKIAPELLSELRKSLPNAKDETTNNLFSRLPGMETLHLSNLSGKDKAIGESIMLYLMNQGWRPLEPRIVQELVKDEGMLLNEPASRPEDWNWLYQARYA